MILLRRAHTEYAGATCDFSLICGTPVTVTALRGFHRYHLRFCYFRHAFAADGPRLHYRLKQAYQSRQHASQDIILRFGRVESAYRQFRRYATGAGAMILMSDAADCH